MNPITDVCLSFHKSSTTSRGDACAVFVAPPLVFHDLDPLQDEFSYLVLLRFLASVLLLPVQV